MVTILVDLADAQQRLAADEPPYAFQISDHTTMLGPACRYGSNYLQNLRSEGRYAESFAEATLVTQAKGVTITGIWFVKS
ncbi:MAG: hypothetical protein HY231_11845 [Acidobacteria bacterium]|nr:hypothetical protein [Acidobacteriota bacterium]